MPYANLQINLSEAQKQNIIDDINNILLSMNYLIHLSKKEKTKHLRLGNKAEAFFTRALELAKENPQLLMPAFSISAMEQDIEAWQKLRDIQVQVSRLLDGLNSTIIALEKENVSASIHFYNMSLSASKQNVVGASTVVENLAPMLPRTGKRTKKK